MVERNSSETAKRGRLICLGAFAVGLVVALALGWWVLPNLMKAEHKQPIAFNHVLHVQDQGMYCADCHYLREDGSFSGRPTTESCASCHFTVIGDNPEEARFVSEYVEKDREIKTEWLVYQKQPDNVFFSHAVHSLDRCNTCHQYEEQDLCSLCHLPVFEQTAPPVYKQNRLSGYSQNTMLMWACESCHAEPQHIESTMASNACFVCHK